MAIDLLKIAARVGDLADRNEAMFLIELIKKHTADQPEAVSFAREEQEAGEHQNRPENRG